MIELRRHGRDEGSDIYNFCLFNTETKMFCAFGVNATGMDLGAVDGIGWAIGHELTHALIRVQRVPTGGIDDFELGMYVVPKSDPKAKPSVICKRHVVTQELWFVDGPKEGSPCTDWMAS